jgi:hypothetical protein
MPDESVAPGDITRCLQDWRGGDEEALSRLTAAVYLKFAVWRLSYSPPQAAIDLCNQPPRCMSSICRLPVHYPASDAPPLGVVP